MDKKHEQKELTKMNFQELWDFLREKDNQKLMKIRQTLEKELNTGDAGLRKKKREFNFKGAERYFITEFFKEFFDNQNFKRDILFPNNIERFANDFYEQKYRKAVV
ncbi:MAG: hypothetical protein L3J56_06670 [Bacteroidales bacterium]|nr:hypothetical protein [Bacteroidales bacterium]